MHRLNVLLVTHQHTAETHRLTGETMQQTLYIFNHGDLKRRQHTLTFTRNDRTPYQNSPNAAPTPSVIPIETTRDMHLFGDVSLNSHLLNFLARHHIGLHLYNYYGQYSGSYLPQKQYTSGYVTLQQARHYLIKRRRMALARRLVQGSLVNLSKTLSYYSKQGKDVHTAQALVRNHLNKLSTSDNIPALMALEGAARQAYYRAWHAILQKPAFDFDKRTIRPPRNRLNSLISFGNSLMYSTCLSAIYRSKLDARIGFLHASNDRPYSLHLDLAEIFKPIIIDRVIFTVINKGMVRPEDFREDARGGVYVQGASKKAFVKAFDAKLKSTLMHPTLKRHVSYQQLIERECYKLEKHLRNEVSYVPYVG